MSDGVRLTIHGSAGWGVAECLMSSRRGRRQRQERRRGLDPGGTVWCGATSPRARGRR
jgi:hypothetical protein